MLKLHTKKLSDGYTVCDQEGYEIEWFSNKQFAVDFIEELKTRPAVLKLYIDNTDWTPKEYVVDNSAKLIPIKKDTSNKEVKTVIESNPRTKPINTKKSETVRLYIALAKANNESEETVLFKAIAELGMSKSLAKAYIKGNWDKV